MKKRLDEMAGYRNIPNQNRCTMYHQMNNNGLLYPSQPPSAHNPLNVHQNGHLHPQQLQNHLQNQQNYHHHHVMTRHYLSQQQHIQQANRHHVMNVSTNIPLNASEYSTEEFIRERALREYLIKYNFFGSKFRQINRKDINNLTKDVSKWLILKSSFYWNRYDSRTIVIFNQSSIT